MVLSPDLITNITFGSVMVLIGLAGIWIVKWSTDRMVRIGQHTISSDEESLNMPVQGIMNKDIPRHPRCGPFSPGSASTPKLSPGGFGGAVADLLVIAKAESSRSLRSNSW